MHYVYRLENKTPSNEKKFYIGVRSSKYYPTEDTKYMGSSKDIKEAINNGELFEKKILCILETRKEANRVERELQVAYDVLKNPLYYNRCIHNVGFDVHGTNINKGKVHTKQSRKNMSEAHIGQKPSKENIEKRRMKMLGRKQTPEHIKKKAESCKGFKHSEEYKKNKSEKMKGRCSMFKGMTNRYSKETLKKMSNSAKNRKTTKSGEPK